MTARAILIIDDDEVDRKSIWRNLCYAKWEGEIVQAADAEEGIRHAQTRSFDCILLDYQLPGTDGLALISKLGTHTPIVMLTGEGNETIAVAAMKLGAADYLPKSLLDPDNLVRVVNHAIETQQLRLALERAQVQLDQQALYDRLTDLGNRRLFLRDLTRMTALAQRHQLSFYLMVLTIDYREPDNAAYGHEEEAAILAEVSRRLTGTGRTTDSFYRINREEFAALLDVPAEAAARISAQRIAEQLALPIQLQNGELYLMPSIGLAACHHGQTAVEDLLRQADAATHFASQRQERIVFAEDVQ